MGTEVIIAAASLAVTAYSANEQQKAAEEAKSERQKAYNEQVKAQSEQKAMNAAQAAQEQRNQIREERIKRARIIQASENTGVGISSGVSGGTGSLSTQLGAGLGFNTGQVNKAAAISDNNQTAAGFLSSAENKIMQANQWGQIGSLGMSIFSQSGGFSNFKSKPTAAPMK